MWPRLRSYLRSGLQPAAVILVTFAAGCGHNGEIWTAAGAGVPTAASCGRKQTPRPHRGAILPSLIIYVFLIILVIYGVTGVISPLSPLTTPLITHVIPEITKNGRTEQTDSDMISSDSPRRLRTVHVKLRETVLSTNTSNIALWIFVASAYQ